MVSEDRIGAVLAAPVGARYFCRNRGRLFAGMSYEHIRQLAQVEEEYRAA